MGSFYKTAFSIFAAFMLLIGPSHSASLLPQPPKVILLRSGSLIQDRSNQFKHYTLPLHKPSWNKSENTKHSFLLNRQSQAIAKCDGKANFIQDLNIVSLATGIISTIMSIFTVSYTSIMGNFVSIISATLSFAFGIPAALITYMAPSDRVSYIAGNILSALSFWNTAYGVFSIVLGSKDIVTSHISNAVGVFSLIISIVTSFPSLFDRTVEWVASFTGQRKPVYEFIRRYGCYGDIPTFYDQINSFVKQKLVYI